MSTQEHEMRPWEEQGRYKATAESVNHAETPDLRGKIHADKITVRTDICKAVWVFALDAARKKWAGGDEKEG